MKIPAGPVALPRTASLLAPVAVLLGCVALAARPAGTIEGFAVTLGVGLIGALAPLPPARDARWGAGRWTGAAALGVGTFGLARFLERPLIPPARPAALAGVIVAAVAEELFFRRLAYGWLARGGALIAVVGAAVLFALVHVPVYGMGVLPLDFAAGLLFGWQRWATGGWTAAAVTHAAANVLQLL
jgi:membrane protease YdiL (CAAX protease family)